MTPPITFGDEGGDRVRQKDSRKMKRFRDASMIQKRESKQDRFGRQRGGRKARWDKLAHPGVLKNRARFETPRVEDTKARYYEKYDFSSSGLGSPPSTTPEPSPPSPSPESPTPVPESIASPPPRKVQLNANAIPFQPSSSLRDDLRVINGGVDGGGGGGGGSRTKQGPGSGLGARGGFRHRRRASSNRLGGGGSLLGERLKVSRAHSDGVGMVSSGGYQGILGAGGGPVEDGRAPGPPSLFESVFKDKLPSLTPRKTPQHTRVFSPERNLEQALEV